MATLKFKYRPPPLAAQAPPGVPAARAAGTDDESDVDGHPIAARDRWWHESSYDLRSGLEVDDDVGRTLPGEILDQLFSR